MGEPSGLLIREAQQGDLLGLLGLYTQLHGSEMPNVTGDLRALWSEILAQPHHHILLGILNGKAVCSCVLLIVPNLTHGLRPYALIENVVTDTGHRKLGFATALLDRAGEIARDSQCYKIMLMTGSKEESTLRFYERAGFNRRDKTAFIRWLE